MYSGLSHPMNGDGTLRSLSSPRFLLRWMVQKEVSAWFVESYAAGQRGSQNSPN